MKKFDPYYTTRVAGEGTGLGLSIVQRIVKSVNGHVSVESEQGKTSFSVYLPCDRKNEEFPVPGKIEELPRGDEAIMLVDDEQVVLAISRVILENLGYKVCSFNGSKIAIESFGAAPESFDLIITNMTMPGMSGFDLSSEKKNQTGYPNHSAYRLQCHNQQG